MTWDTFLTLRGTKGIYLDHVGTLRPSKSYGWGGGVVGWVAHKILVSAQGPLVFGIWVWGLGVWGLGLTIKQLYFCHLDSDLVRNKTCSRVSGPL